MHPTLAPAPTAQVGAPSTPTLRDSLNRCAYLLNSARLVIDDDVARATATAAVDEALAVLDADARQQRTQLAPVTAAVTPPTPSTTPPPIGQHWPGQGGIYAGIARGRDGAPDSYLILADAKPSDTLSHAEKLTWQASIDWAKTVSADGHTDFTLPERFESALLYANLADQFEGGWHWTGTQASRGNACYQLFDVGYQGITGKSYEGRARAVRRFSVQSFSHS